jgi:hypothetical protein
MVKAKAFIAIALLGAMPVVLTGLSLQTETLSAWGEYIRSADLRMQERLDGRKPFLWIDESTDRRQRVESGEIVVAPVISHGTQHVADGLIHHWIGGIFIPHATIEGLSAVTHAYNRYKEFYKPAVSESKLVACTENEQKFSMVWQAKVLVVAAALAGEYRVRDIRVDSHRRYSISDTLEISEIENYGKSGERRLPPGTGNGYIWRLHSISRNEERDGGVYLERETVALTRDIPGSLRWVANPVISHLSINALTTLLRQTKDAFDVTPVKSRVGTYCSNEVAN